MNRLCMKQDAGEPAGNILEDREDNANRDANERGVQKFTKRSLLTIGTNLEKEEVALEHRLQFCQSVLGTNQVMVKVPANKSK